MGINRTHFATIDQFSDSETKAKITAKDITQYLWIS